MVALTAPAGLGGAAFQSADIDPTPFVRREPGGIARLELAVKGARCAACIQRIEEGLGTMPGVTSARLNLSTAKLSVTWREGALAPAAIVERVQSLGYEAAPYDPQALLANEDEEGRFLLRCLAVAGFGAANVMLLSVSVWAGHDGEMGAATRTLFHWISGLIAIPAALYAGRPFFRGALAGLSKGSATMDMPISLGVLLALGLSIGETLLGGEHAYFDAAVSLCFLLLIGRYLDHLLRRKARAAARDLIAMQTVTVRRLDGEGRPQALAARDVAPGDRLLLAPGDRTPVDGVIESGGGTFDLALVTGESAPVSLRAGQAVQAGAVALDASSVLRASARVQDSLIAGIARLLEAGQQSRSRYVRLADSAARLYVPVVHSIALAVFIGWYFLTGDVRVALTNAITLLIITCPCALGLAVPAVQVVATGRLFKRGILVKSGDALERLAEANAAVFDKTGTLTLGRPRLLNADVLAPETLARAALLARASRHPLARALALAAGPGPVADVQEIAGEGLSATIEGRALRLGRAAFVGASDADTDTSVLWFKDGDAAPLRFAFADRLRTDARESLDALKARGLSLTMLTGDREGPAREAAAALGVTDWTAGIDPLAKAARLEAMKAGGARVLMVGDGLNDAGALALAYVSISPGTAADATQDAADMVLQGEALSPIVEAVDVARAARRRVLENFAFAVLYNACAVPLGALGLVTPLIAALAMSGSSLIVTLNALRLTRTQ